MIRSIEIVAILRLAAYFAKIYLTKFLMHTFIVMAYLIFIDRLKTGI